CPIHFTPSAQSINRQLLWINWLKCPYFRVASLRRRRLRLLSQTPEARPCETWGFGRSEGDPAN
ncbi:hypothetical protein, partial [Synechococcus lacustris]|uniref:hypothetical protein n=1 Tax=Synechococcus lacustris TaxID=2116544 RepID=UPI0020CF963A